MEKVLFLTHETSRTGAPMVLLHFLKWLREHKPEVVIDVIALEGGTLEPDFKNNCHTFYNYVELLKPKPLSYWQRLLLKLKLFKKPDPKEILLQKLVKNNYKIIYANTVITIPLASTLINRSSDSKLVAHIHELNVIIKQLLPNFKDYLPVIHQFIAPSKLVKTSLVSNWSVPEQRIEVVYECTTIKNTKKTHKTDGVFTVGASGLVHWRKGHEVFIQLARYIQTHYPKAKIKFVWVGKLPIMEQIILEADIEKLGLQDVVDFIGEVEDPSSYYNTFDVFVMSSREDPFPLVCIEVGMLGKPIISFEKATGTNEIIEQGGGFVVPYLNVEAMAEKVMAYYTNKSLIEIHGTFNKKAFSQFTPEHICPKLFEIIENVALQK